MPTTKELKNWQRSKYTSVLVSRIRSTIKELGYNEERGIVPLGDTLSVIVSKEDKVYNIRLDRKTLSLVETYSLDYKKKKDKIKKIVRKKCQ